MIEIKVKYVNLPLQYNNLKEEILQAVEKIFETGQFILGPEVESLEKRFANYCETKHSLGVGNGTDAILLVLKALRIGKGDEVITAPNSFIATAAAIANTGAKPVFVDVRDDYNINPELIEQAITEKTKAILPVHLTGRPSDMNLILEIAEKHDLSVIEDAAQAVSARYHNKRVGSFGIAGCFSLHPLKNLNACGDGGLITTNNKELYSKLLKMRNHGLKNRDECEFWGYNSRLDALQAAILNIKMGHLDAWNKKIQEIAAFYRQELEDLEQLKLPSDEPYEEAVYHTFIIQAENRDELQKHLFDSGVETKIHYPIPIHLQASAGYLGYKKGDFPVTEKQAKVILSLPIYPELTQEQAGIVVEAIKTFYSK